MDVLIIVLSVVGFLLGFLVALYIGERGRRKDLMWIQGLHERPRGEELRAEYQEGQDPDTNARRRAEIHAIKQGLMQEAARQGISPNAEEIHQEALRLATRMDTELGA